MVGYQAVGEQFNILGVIRVNHPSFADFLLTRQIPVEQRQKIAIIRCFVKDVLFIHTPGIDVIVGVRRIFFDCIFLWHKSILPQSDSKTSLLEDSL